MELYIRIVDGQPYEHPIHAENFRLAFPEIDTNNLPPEFARFVRVEPPRLGVYEKNQTVTYQLVDGVYTDVFSCEQMTAEEIKAKQDEVKASWEGSPLVSWTFNEEICHFSAPTPYPQNGKRHVWDEPTLSWIEVSNA